MTAPGSSSCSLYLVIDKLYFYVNTIKLNTRLYLRAGGLSLRAIADWLNVEGQTTRRGRPWNPVQDSRVLERIYTIIIYDMIKLFFTIKSKYTLY